MFDIVAIGELLIDFTQSGTNAHNAALFARNPGGAPANVLAANSRLGGKSAFIGKVGDDMFGDFLIETLESIGISTDGIVKSQTANTTLAFVRLDSQGDRSFSFYRNPGADMLLEVTDIPDSLLSNCRIFHFGSISLTDEPSRSATIYAVAKAKENGAIISYDPNYRPFLWKSEKNAKDIMLSGFKFADVAKVSDDELSFLFGCTDLEEGSMLMQNHGPKLVIVSLGKQGSFYRYKNICKKTETFDVNTVDTTGAGDAFWGAVLNSLKNKTVATLDELTETEIDGIMTLANAAGSLTTTRQGAISACPTIEEINRLINDAKA